METSKLNNWNDYRTLATDPNFYAYKAVVAADVDAYMAELSEEEFVVVCNYVYDWVLHSDITVAEAARTISRGLHDKEITMADFDKYDNHGQSNVDVWVNNQF